MTKSINGKIEREVDRLVSLSGANACVNLAMHTKHIFPLKTSNCLHSVAKLGRNFKDNRVKGK